MKIFMNYGKKGVVVLVHGLCVWIVLDLSFKAQAPDVKNVSFHVKILYYSDNNVIFYYDAGNYLNYFKKKYF